jgi:probable rRNA maturation factor
VQPDPPLKTELALQFAEFPAAARHRAVLDRTKVALWIELALARPFEMTVRVVDEDEACALNLQFRGVDHATNVLTFAYGSTADLVLCAPIVQSEARAQGKSLEAHYAHLIVHGCLHAQGYDHEAGESGALEMEALEILLLGALGFDNPY